MHSNSLYIKHEITLLLNLSLWIAVDGVIRSYAFLKTIAHALYRFFLKKTERTFLYKY